MVPIKVNSFLLETIGIPSYKMMLTIENLQATLHYIDNMLVVSVGGFLTHANIVKMRRKRKLMSPNF